MCSLFDQSLPLDELLRLYNVESFDDLEFAMKPKNFPRERIRIVLQAGGRRLVTARWGLVPAWMTEEPKVQPFNARGETVATNGLFRAAFRNRRCIIPARRYAEYEGPKGKRTPVWFEPTQMVLSLAGLWEEWRQPDGGMLSTVTMVTCEPNPLVAPIKDRMPVVLEGDAIDIWLDNDRFNADELNALTKPLDPDSMILSRDES